jgi:hypothetical protein
MYDFITADRIETTISQHLQIVDRYWPGSFPRRSGPCAATSASRWKWWSIAPRALSPRWC